MSERVKNEPNWGELYAERAAQPDPTQENGIAIPRVREARDMVYNGTMPVPGTEPAPQPMPGVQRNRRTARRKYSPFNIILLLLGVAVVTVLYISNILAVGRLLTQINILERTHQRLLNEQEMLRAQINHLSSLERVEQLAGAELGLRPPADPPVWLEVDEERTAELDNALKERHRQ